MPPRLLSSAVFDGRVGIGDVLRHRTFAVLYSAETQSVVGDQLARVALAVLVLDATDSVAATALAYAITFLPAILGGWLVAGIGDRWNRRAVLVACELVRAGLFATLCLPGMPIAAMFVLLGVAVLLGPLFSAVEVSSLAADLGPEEFRLATGLRLSTAQLAQVAGFAAGGALVAWLSPRGALLVDAATFAVSALLIGLLLPRAARAPKLQVPVASEDFSDGEGCRPASRLLLWTDRRIRMVLAFTLLVSFYVVPEALAVPFGRGAGLSTARVGLLLAAIPLGAAVGALALVTWSPPRMRLSAARVMAVLAGIPLLGVLAEPPFGWLLALWLLTGVLTAYPMELTAVLAELLPGASRARLFGAVGALLLAGQGVGILLFGLIAQGLGSAGAIAVAGGCGVVCGAFFLVFAKRNGTAQTQTS